MNTSISWAGFKKEWGAVFNNFFLKKKRGKKSFI